MVEKHVEVWSDGDRPMVRTDLHRRALRRTCAAFAGAVVMALAFAGCPSSSTVDGGAGGKGGGAAGVNGAGGVGAFGGQSGEGCVDIVVTGTFEDTPPWAPYYVSGGVWRTKRGLHIGWKAETGQPSPHIWLYVATYDPEDGAFQRLRRYDVFPDGVTFEKGDIQGIGGSDSEYFAACLRSWDAQGKPRNQSLFIGRLDDDSAQMQVDLGWPSGMYDVGAVAWDGEAFSVHSMDNATGEIFVTRVSPSGRVLLPQTAYGRTASPGVSYRMSTSPVSGMSYLFDAPSSARFVSGHDRGGVPLSWAYPMPLDLQIEGFAPFFAGAVHPGVSTDAEGGAWLSWDRDDGAHRVVAHISKDGKAEHWAEISMRSGFRAPAVIASSPTRVWVADTDAFDISAAELDDGVIVAPQLVVAGPNAKESGKIWYADHLAGMEWQGERWMSFTEPNNILHVVKVKPGCVYRSTLPR